ncbi:MAG TPA: hypothetical protein VGJ70_18330 [Solirubrobacteraceae bacterium]
MSGQERQPTEEELRAAYEAELKKVRVEDVVVQTILSLISLGGRKAGLAPGSEDERDPDQLRQAIEAVRTLLPLVEPALGPDAAKVRDALSQLQLTYAQLAREPAERPAPAPGEGEQPGGPGPAQSSGRLWVPGQ